MKTRRCNKLAVVVAGFSIFSSVAAGQQQPAPKTSSPQREIVVSLEDHKLALLEDGQVQKVYTVAVGKPSSPSPEGTFTIERRVANPTYQHDGKTVPPGPANPVGTRWVGLNKRGYGIHGTNEPSSIGKASSHGCIRMARADLEEFYSLVAVGDTVTLVGHRNAQTARLFGGDPLLAPSSTALQPTETAHSEPPSTEPTAASAANTAIVPAPTGIAIPSAR